MSSNDSSWIKIGDIDSLIEDSCNLFDSKLGKIIIIKKSDDGSIHALTGICTHEEFELDSGFVQENSVICPLHLSAFDIKSGEALNPPAEEPLTVYETKLDNNTIYIRKRNKNK
ncbi:MAG: Rieske (2Fe-2S) protein [Candidatus Thorarchaeota archaeon]